MLDKMDVDNAWICKYILWYFQIREGLESERSLGAVCYKTSPIIPTVSAELCQISKKLRLVTFDEKYDWIQVVKNHQQVYLTD